MSQLPEIARALLKPEAYIEHTGKVSLIQTQMSFVFLTDDFVYKVKKPVNLGYLDYTTLEKRRIFCEKEVELNLRLCPNTYLGVVAITKQDGEINTFGDGKVIEYAVKMLKLPKERMMDSLILDEAVTLKMIDRLSQKIAVFHEQAATGDEIDSFGKLDIIKQNTEENFKQSDKYIGKTLSHKQYDAVKKYTHSFIENNERLFERRVIEGRIRDLHGDLHAAHICFCDDICIYDCIEFNDRFRYGDTASEVAFLAMDLDHYGRADLSRHFVNKYIEKSGDKELKTLLNFYKCYRAYVRGKVANFKLDDPYISDSEREATRLKAQSYFNLAHSYTRERPQAFITVGLVGSGKTTLAKELAKELGLVVLSSDITRKRLAGIPQTEHRYEEIDSGIYSPGFTEKTYQTLFKEAEDILKDKGSVIIDASFIKARRRKEAQELALKTGADFHIVECALDEDTTRKRLTKRFKEKTASDGRWEVFLKQMQAYEQIEEMPNKRNRVIIDTSKLVTESVREVIAKVYCY